MENDKLLSYKIYKMIKMAKPTNLRFICAQKKGYDRMIMFFVRMGLDWTAK